MLKIELFDKYAQRYDNWFKKNQFVYWSEFLAIESLLPDEFIEGLDVGVGTGRFASPLGIKYGIEPSAKMREIAKQRGVEVMEGIAEKLPFEDSRFDVLLMVNSICFLDDIVKSIKEAYRVLKPCGYIIIGFIDKNSFLGRQYQNSENNSEFYASATFYTPDEVTDFLKKAGFTDPTFVQTIFQSRKKINKVEPARDGYGEGSFVVVRAKKESLARRKIRVENV